MLALLSCLVDVASKDNSNFGKGLGHSETPRLHRGTSYEPSSEISSDVKNDPDFRGHESSINTTERPR